MRCDTDDDMPPPDGLKDSGFVSRLQGRVQWALLDWGMRNASVWIDRVQIHAGYDFSEEIQETLKKAELFVAVLSQNYIQREWTIKELEMMAARIQILGKMPPRIFRVDKNEVEKDQIPEALRTIQAVRFYSKEVGAQYPDEFFRFGRVRRHDEYEDAVYQLTQAIRERLRELGVELAPAPPSTPVLETYPDNGHVVFVAKPAGDMVEEYRTLVRELRGRGYRVLPNPDKDFGTTDGAEIKAAVETALAEAEAAVHVLGERRGFRPEEAGLELVPLQLAATEKKAAEKTDFVRLIWAPEVLLPGSSNESQMPRRNPLSVFADFGGQLLEGDQVVGDTLSRFSEVVLQRLERRRVGTGKSRVKSKTAGRRQPAPVD
jgi:TIR domain